MLHVKGFSKPMLQAASICLLSVLLTGHSQAAANTGHNPDQTLLLAPRALPFAVTHNSGVVPVSFTLRSINLAPGSIDRIRLIQQAKPDLDYALNDAGLDGDRIAGDGIFGGRIEIDTNAYTAGTCLAFKASAKLEQTSIESPLQELCVTRFPSEIFDSDTRVENRVKLPEIGEVVGNELLIRFIENSQESRLLDLVDAIGGRVVGSILPRRMLQVAFAERLTLTQLNTRAEVLRSQAEIENAYLNPIGTYAFMPNDPEFGNQHGLQTINADDAWDAPATGSGVTVTVLDSGVQTHDDLPVATSDLVNHGTAIAGIVAAETNDLATPLGIAGIAFDSALDVVTVSSDIAVSFVEMVNGFTTVAAAGVGSVVNASFYHSLAPPVVDSPVIDQFDLCAAIDDVVLSGAIPTAVVVVAAGNDGTDGYHYPARCNDSTETAHGQLTNKELLIVAGSSVSCPGLAANCGVDTADTIYSGSNYGAWVDVFAPGTNVRSTNTSNLYEDYTGTSFSAPMVSAAAAILDSCGVALDQIETTLESSASVNITMLAGGSRARIDIDAALQSVNDAPSAINIAGASFAFDENMDSNAGDGLLIGAVSVVDADGCDHHSYSFVGGDAAFFSEVGGNLFLSGAGLLDYETMPSYSTTLRVTDAYGAVFDLALMISVNDLPEPVDLVLVIDRSGSMNGPSAVSGSKLMALKSAADLFIDQISMDSVHRLGLVQFNTAVVPFVAPDIFPFGTLNPANAGAAHDAIDSIDGGGGTNVLGGLQQGVDDLDVTPASARQVAVLFTDGRHNSPNPLADAAMQTELEARINAVSSMMELYSIGFGTSISDLPLSAAANANGGWHVNELDPLSMAKDFSLVAADVMDNVALSDPVFTLKPGQAASLDIAVSAADRNLTFVVHWDQFDPSRVNSRIIAADGACELEASAAGVKQALGINYVVTRVDLPYRCADKSAHGGNWQVKIVAGENNRSLERVDILAYASSKIRLKNRLELDRNQLQIGALLTGNQFKNAGFTAFVTAPLPEDDKSSKNDELGSDPDRVGDIPKPENIERAPREIELKPDDCNADTANCPDNQASAGGSFKLDGKGLYQVRVVALAVDNDGRQIRREQTSSIYFTPTGFFDSWHWWLACLLVLLILVVLVVLLRRRSRA